MLPVLRYTHYFHLKGGVSLEELLKMEHISKRFGSFYANRDITLTVRRGEVHTLLGENGAGKSTLMNILIGLYQPTEGRILWNGKEEKITSPAHAVKLGIGMVHQHFMLVEAMTVFENISLGDRNAKGIFIDRDKRRKEILELSEKYGLQVELDKYISEISGGAQQRVEILKALYHGADLLILDEPSAALTDIEVEGLFAIMKKLVDDGKSIIFISHKMREVMHVSDRITILRNGEAVGTVDGKTASEEDLVAMMIGHRLAASQYEKVRSDKKDVLSLQNISYHKNQKHNGLNRVSLSVKRGEIVGIAGVDGNGQTQLAQIVTGVIAPEEGTMERSGEKIGVFDPSEFISGHVGHVPEDRNQQGLVGDMSVSDNLILKTTDDKRFSVLNGMLLKKNAIRKYSQLMTDRYDIRCRSTAQDVRSLSGGNQQKVIIAREIEAMPELLVAAHPTRGLDIGASRFVHDKMIEARDYGTAILMISADFDEVLEMSDRILVVFEGQVMGEFSGKDPDVGAISLAMTGKAGEEA